MAAEVGCSLVLDQEGAQLLQQAVSRAVLRDGPHRVVASDEEEVSLGAGEAILQPGQLLVGKGAMGTTGLLVQKVIGFTTQQNRVQHEDGHSAVRLRDAEVQLVVVVRELPEGWATSRFKDRQFFPSFTTTCESQTRGSPSLGHLCVINLSLDVPCMVMVASNDKPWDVQRLGSVHSLEGLLKGPEIKSFHSTETSNNNKQQWTKSVGTNLKPGVIDISHPLVIKVVSQGENKICSHVLSNSPHLNSRGLLNGGDVGRVGEASPVSKCQEANR